jgi:hypothetical protein
MSAQVANAIPRTHAAGGDAAMRQAEILTELARVLAREAEVVHALREALVRQRAGVAADSTPDVHGSCDDIARILVALDNARRHRSSLLANLAGGTPTTLEALARELGGTLPPELAEAAAVLRREAEGAAREAAVNRTVLKRTVEAGEAFLQALFTDAGEPEAVYRPGERRDDDGAGFLLDRKV